MIKVAICDDEENILEQMKKLLREYKKENIEVCSYASGEALLEAQDNYDVIFLDIDIQELSGIDTAKQIRVYDKKVKLIYLTNYRDYVGSAFAVHAFGYLLRPVKKEIILQQLDEALNYLEQEQTVKEIEFQTVDGKVRVDVKDIFYFFYSNRTIIIHTRRQKHVIKDTMSDVYCKMQDEGFEVPHKSFCVNLFQVKRVKGYDIEMMNQDIIPLSQKKSVKFRQRLNEYISDQIRL